MPIAYPPARGNAIPNAGLRLPCSSEALLADVFSKDAVPGQPTQKTNPYLPSYLIIAIPYPMIILFNTQI